MPTNETSLGNLPEDKQALQAMLRALWHEREQQKQRIEELSKRSDDLYLETLQLQKELLRYKKATYGRKRTGAGAARVCRRTGTKTVTGRGPSARRSRAGSATRTAAQRTAGLSEFRKSSGQHALL